MEKYGVDHVMKSAIVREHMRQNLVEKYGDDYCNILWGNKGNPGQSRRAFKFILNNPNVSPLFSEDEFVEGKKKDVNTKFPFKCKHCGTEFLSVWDNGGSRACPTCKQIKASSVEETEIYEYISSITDDRLCRNDRKLLSPLELDIVDHDKKICFEFDGLYWHCDDINRNRRYHLAKTERCESSGYRLIHIFENEWVHSKEIVKSRIADLYGKYDSEINAEDCDIREVDASTCRSFLESNHLRGWCQSSVSLGLFFGGELVSIMTFGRPRFNKRYEWELLRCCSKLNHHIAGCAERLLGFFEKNYQPKSLVSYADRRWSNGGLYKRLGFLHLENTVPNYWYVDFREQILISRMKFQKHNIKDLSKEYDASLSVSENVKNNGYGRIYDCGNMVFVKSYDTREPTR
jgi:predicted Zn-ribbon and HTH transcriptional regulator